MIKQGGTDIDVLKAIPPDKGCELATAYLREQSKCQDCPFPECLEDIPDGKRKLIKRQRDAEIIMLRKQGKTVKELASMFGLTVRTILRIIAHGSKSAGA